MQSTHLSLSLEVDFDKKQLIGQATHKVKCIQDHDQVIFDVVGLDVHNVEVKMPQGQKVVYSNFTVRTDLNPLLGNALVVDLPEMVYAGQTLTVIIDYNTNEKSWAINWLQPSQTAGKKLPYLFTQCESISCRSLAPM